MSKGRRNNWRVVQVSTKGWNGRRSVAADQQVASRVRFNTSHQLVYQVEREKTNNYTWAKWTSQEHPLRVRRVILTPFPPALSARLTAADRVFVSIYRTLGPHKAERPDSRFCLFTPILRNPYNVSLFLILPSHPRAGFVLPTDWGGNPIHFVRYCLLPSSASL